MNTEPRTVPSWEGKVDGTKIKAVVNDGCLTISFVDSQNLIELVVRNVGENNPEKMIQFAMKKTPIHSGVGNGILFFIPKDLAPLFINHVSNPSL